MTNRKNTTKEVLAEVDSRAKELADRELVSNICSDFAERQRLRRPYELMWQLNMNFVMGNQYCSISGRGEVEQEEKFFFWQEKQVYNHIASIVETRMSRLSRVRPRPIVRPFSSSEGDIAAAKLASKILDAVSDRLELSSLITQATMWSEICGTSFYKVSWDKGVKNGTDTTGDVRLTVCPPFEIYPDSNVCQTIGDCQSIIHARVYSVADIKKMWGVDVVGQRVQVFSFDGMAAGVGGLGYNSAVKSLTQETKNDHAVVIERYTKPDVDSPNGKLEIVAGDKLVYVGELPYTLIDGARSFPFIRQTAFLTAGCFWGSSVVERCIPIQRAYNAVKCRKHEFLNRLSMGILAVEDGSVDVSNLEEEGLSPGKILVYRQGSNMPRIMDCGSVPAEFTYEEDRLLREFTKVSGVSEFASNSVIPSNVTSGVALQQLTNQDDTRLAITTDSLREAIVKISKFILNLYKQFAFSGRLAKICDNQGNVEEFYFKNSDINSDDVVFETENELSDSIASRRAMVMQLLSSGVLHDKDGRLSESTKAKVVSMLGFGNWENSQDINAQHKERAEKENVDITAASVYPVDDHDIHIEVHTKCVISGEADRLGEGVKDAIMQHILMHKLAKEGGSDGQV